MVTITILRRKTSEYLVKIPQTIENKTNKVQIHALIVLSLEYNFGFSYWLKASSALAAIAKEQSSITSLIISCT